MSTQVLLQVKGENLRKIKVGLTFVDGIGSGYSATCKHLIQNQQLNSTNVNAHKLVEGGVKFLRWANCKRVTIGTIQWTR